jgi:hypothetical protein
VLLAKVVSRYRVEGYLEHVKAWPIALTNIPSIQEGKDDAYGEDVIKLMKDSHGCGCNEITRRVSYHCLTWGF